MLFVLSATLQAQNTEKLNDTAGSYKKTFVSFKGDIKAAVYIDGKKYDSDILSVLDAEKIESISVLKGESAETLYNESEVIIITTKEGTVRDEGMKSGITIRHGYETDYPLIIIDGKVVPDFALKGLSPDSIKSIQVIKDGAGKEKYNTDSPVILITTKSKKSSKTPIK